MAGQEKVMGYADLEKILKKQFPEEDKSNKVDILLEQITKSKTNMEKELGEENPFFYGAISEYISSQSSKGIDDWVDSKGNINVYQINTATTIAKKQFETAKENEANNQQAQKDYPEQVLEQPEEVIKQEFTKIDYNNLTEENLMYIAENMSLFRQISSYKDYSKVSETIGVILGIDSKIIEWQKVAKFQLDNPNGTLSSTQKEILDSAPKELLDSDGKSFDQKKMTNLDSLLSTALCEEIIQKLRQGEVINKETIRNLIYDKAHNHFGFSKELSSQLCELELFNDLDGKSPEEQKNIINQKIKEKNEIQQKSLVEQEPQESLDDESLAAINEYDQEQIKVSKDSKKSIEQMQAENDSAMTSRFEKQQDFASEEHQSTLDVQEVKEENPTIEDDVFAVLEEYDTKQEPSKENKYEAPTFEEKRTGLAGLFSRIANSRAAKAVTNLFKPKAKQDRLGPGQPQKTVKEGLEITTYEGGGNSIEPLPMKFRSLARNMGAKIMEGIVSITNLGKGNQDNQVINTPTVISDQQLSVEDKPKELEAKDMAQQTTIFRELSKEEKIEFNKKNIALGQEAQRAEERRKEEKNSLDKSGHQQEDEELTNS